MKIIFKSETRTYEAEVDGIEDIYQAIRDGLVAMSYHKDTAKDLVEGLKEDD